MRFRRALLIADPSQDPAPALDALRRVAPQLERLLVVAPPAVPSSFRLLGERSAERDDAALARLREASTGIAPQIDVRLAAELHTEAFAALCVAEQTDLIVFGSRSLRSASVLPVPRSRLPVAILWPAEAAPPHPGPIQHIGCVALDDRSRVTIGAFLRDHADPSIHVTLLSLSGLEPDALSNGLEVSGVRVAVDVSSLRGAASMRQWIDEWTRTRPFDLLVVTRIPSAVMVATLSTAPVLVLPLLAVHGPSGQRALDLSDLVDLGGPIHVRVDQVLPTGGLAPVPDQTLAFVSGGRVVASVLTVGGEADLPVGLGVTSVGAYRVGDSPPADPLAAIEERVAVLRPDMGEVVLVDAGLPDDRLRQLKELPSEPAILPVRLRPTRTCASIRQRLRSVGLPARVLDARAVLDEGEALDVSASLDPVRLARVACRLRRAGFAVTAIAHRGPPRPLVEGFKASSGPALEVDSAPPPGGCPSPSEGNRIEIELDNATARGWLLEAIERSRQSLHLQVYMALDDDVGREIEAALAAAGARGVTIRVLVDSLHGLHASFGTTNPLLQRISAYPGVELRTSRPISDLPSLVDLKQRDHRKLVLSDGRLALIGGRNLGHEYYTAFTEVPVTAETPWRQIPWLDAGARVQGPAVATLSASFHDAWTEAGGAPFEIAVPPPAGSSVARVVVHRGLRDARTLEAYLELIESARSHIDFVSGYPLVLELQHALLRALGRGVRVRALVGYLTPTHDGRPFKGSWATARGVATELVHSRMDPIVASGGEVFLFARRDVPGWDPGLGVVHPHVHAKVLSADGRRCAVGSANMDVTASYWESELLLVVEDAAVARALEAELDTLMAGSLPVNRHDPAWRQLAQRRAWMRHWPGVLSA